MFQKVIGKGAKSERTIMKPEKLKGRVLLLLVGESGSGKTTLANYLRDEYGLKILESYTSRPKRTPDETGHIFISSEEAEYMMIHEKIVADTRFDGNLYFATQDQVDDADVYIVDPRGLAALLRNYSGSKDLLSFFLDTDEAVRAERMRTRGDSEGQISKRLENDRWMFRGTYHVDCILNGNKSTKHVAKWVMRFASFYLWLKERGEKS